MKVTIMHPSEIEMGNRFRDSSKFTEEATGEGWADFLESIRTKGILQPITINQNHLLIAGGRRLAAAIQLELASIPVLIRQTDDELDLRECELMENVFRKDLHWQEKINISRRIHELMIEKHGEKKWSMRKTAGILNRSVGGLSRCMDLAKNVERFPALQNCNTEDEAVKLLRKAKEKLAAKLMVEEHSDQIEKHVSGEAKEANPKILLTHGADDMFRIGDAFEGLQRMLDENLKPPISFIEVDPPYGIDIHDKKKGKKDRKLDKYSEVPSGDYPVFLDNLCTQLFQVTPKITRMIFWFGVEWYAQVKRSLEHAGFTVDPIPCIWVKPAGQTNNPELYLARCYEPFFTCWKGKGIPIRERGRRNVFEFHTVPAARKYHPTQRPIDLMQEILRTFAWPGSLMMVPFLGSGSTLIAGYREGITGFGWELNDENKEPFLAAVQTDVKDWHRGESGLADSSHKDAG